MNAACAAAVILALVTPPAHAQSRAGASQAPGAVEEFQARLQAYLALRTEIAGKTAPLEPMASGAELAAQQARLAGALRAARAHARPGDLVPDALAADIRRIVLEDFRRRTAAAERAIFSEVPRAPRPAINRTYPVEAALPTVPPLLLRSLPRLPDNLQYRFYGRHLLLLDGDLQIIVDYIENVLPPS